MIHRATETTKTRAASPLLHDPLPGTDYRAVRRIGGGASSEVYEAIAPGGARCAVKVLRSIHVHDPEAVSRIEQESRALAALDHPSVVRVIDAGTTASWKPFFVMPLLEGETLRDRLRRRGRLAPVVACAIAAEMLEGLDAAHRGGVVHRDVKPANVFLPFPKPGAPSRRAVLLDFGVAKLAGPSRETTGAQVIGTPRYLAPEQILAGRIDARTDVYAAGLVLFEMIAGSGPYDRAAGPIELMRAHIEERPASLRDLVPVSPELSHAIARAIAKSPARRWPSARAFAAVLARAADRERQNAQKSGLAFAQERAS